MLWFFDRALTGGPEKCLNLALIKKKMTLTDIKSWRS
jgi:hypothetical protein